MPICSENVVFNVVYCSLMLFLPNVECSGYVLAVLEYVSSLP